MCLCAMRMLHMHFQYLLSGDMCLSGGMLLSQESVLPGAWTGCNVRVCHCCVHVSVILIVITVYQSFEAHNLVWGWRCSVCSVPAIGRLGGTSHRCMACGVMCAQRMFS